MTSYVSTFFSNFFSFFGASTEVDCFDRDLQFIKRTILENHPGVQNPLDPDFVAELNKSCRVAERLLNGVYSEEEKMSVLKDFGKSFKDSHLWVHYDFIKSSQVILEKPPKVFGIQKLNDGVSWITIPTFAPTKNQKESLQEIINQLPQLRQHVVLFDLRGNGGGDSRWGNELLKALFGAEYLNHSLAQMNRDVFVEWRASPGNLEHVEKFIPMLKGQFEEGHPVFGWAERTHQGMKSAVESGNFYYSEQKNKALLNADVVSLFQGKVYAIVDKHCVSACLDFLDGLRAVEPGVVLIGESTNADSVYMELRTVELPSTRGTFGFPIKVYRNRPRGHNLPYLPDIQYGGDLQDTSQLQQFILSRLISPTI